MYAVSLIKFYWRDPLSTNVGPQGFIELTLLLMTALTLLLSFRQRHWELVVTSSAKAFLAFGAIAVGCSIFSFYPLLSFAKGLSFILVCGIAIVASSAFRPAKALEYLYYSIVIVLSIGVIVKLASGGPLLEVDDWSGRARLELFGLHATSLADLSAVTLLSSLLLPTRPRFYWQALLFTINIAAGSRTSSALLVLILFTISLTTLRSSQRFLLVNCCLGFLLAASWFVVQTDYLPAVDLTSIAQPLYGDKLTEDIWSLNGRTSVWDAAAPLVSHSLLLGYGMGGARDVLINNTSWNWVAGDSHNALIELIVSGGVPATLIFLLGWAGAIVRAWRWRGLPHIGALGMYGYIAGFGIVSPNLISLQALSTFVILTIDAMVCADFAIGHAHSSELRIVPVCEGIS